jgi:uncharacterized BrkB/YihY/UPF0761 family membrane protein
MTKEKRKKIFYYIGELCTLGVTLISVVLSDVIASRAKGNAVQTGDIQLDWLNLTISAILALMTYGFGYSDFRYVEDAKKPPLVKRLSNAVLTGIAWRSILGWTNGGGASPSVGMDIHPTFFL